MRTFLIGSLLFLSVQLFGQIGINTNFEVLTNQPIDTRDTLGTIGDTSTITWEYPGLITYMVDVAQHWYYTGAYWTRLASPLPDSLVIGYGNDGFMAEWLNDTVLTYRVFNPNEVLMSNAAGAVKDTSIAAILSMGGAPTGSGVNNQVAVWSGTSTLDGSYTFLWDGTELSVGTTNSAYTLDVGTGGFRLAPESADPTGASGVQFFDSDDLWFKGYNGTQYWFYGRTDDVDPGANRVWFQNSTNTAQTTSSQLTYNASTGILTGGTVKSGDVFVTLDIRQSTTNASANVSIGTTFDHGASTSVLKGVAIGSDARLTGTGSTDATAIGAAAYAATQSTAIGSGAVSAQYSTAIGRNSSATQSSSIAIGNSAVANAVNQPISIGQGSSCTGQWSITIGSAVSVSGNNSIRIGSEAGTVAHVGSIVIGNNSSSTADGEFIASGFKAGTTGITNVFFGSGPNRYSGADGAGVNYTINGSGARGTNQIGGNITIAGGKGTGTGSPGSVVFSTSTAGASGSTLQTLTERARFDAAGRLGIGTTSPDSELEVVGKAKITSLPDSLFDYRVVADANGRLARSAFAYAEMYIQDTDPDTVNITAGTPAECTDWSSSVASNFTYSGGRLTYTGTETAVFEISSAISTTADNLENTIKAWVYWNGSRLQKSGSYYVSSTYGYLGVVSPGCLVTLATNDYIEIFFDTSINGNVYVQQANVRIKKL